ncbi:MAG: ABC transporter permease subunit [Cypionkella sp.]
MTIVGPGQMLVVTTGHGNIDSSIPSVITLNAYLALLTNRGLDSNLAFGVLAALAAGLLVGGPNVLLAVALRNPAIIATLATGYVLATTTLLANRQILDFAVSNTPKSIADGPVSATRRW